MDRDYDNYLQFLNRGRKVAHTQQWFAEQTKYLGQNYVQLNDYKSLQTPVTFYHKICGREWQVLPENIVYHHAHCNYCFNHRGIAKLIKFCQAHDLEILSPWQKKHGVMKFQSKKCGHVFYRRAGNLYANWHCPYCNHFKRLTRPNERIKMKGNHIKQIRQERSITQIQLADLACISVNSEQAYENHKSQPTGNVIYRMAKALNVSAEELMGWDDLTGKAKSQPEPTPMAWNCSHCKSRNMVPSRQLIKYENYRKKGGDNDWMYLRCRQCAQLSRVVMGENISYYVKEVY